MKKAFKNLLLAGSTGIMVLTLASCGGDSRNSSIPYGENKKYNSDTVIPTATNDITNEAMKTTQGQFYSRLRYSSNSVVQNNIKKAIYNKEYNASVDLLLHENLADVANDTKEFLTLTKNGESLYNISETTLDYTGNLSNYNYIRRNIINSISSSVSSSLFSASSAEKIEEMEAYDIETYYTKFMEAQ
jgi:hypothetical protein